MANDPNKSEEYNLHFQNLDAYARGAKEKGVPLFQFLYENVGLETDLANELIKKWTPSEDDISPTVLLQ
jgi:hypothetical protein